MRYSFIESGERVILKTWGSKHTEFAENLTLVTADRFSTITHNCFILKKTSSFEAVDGTCYDFYEVSDYIKSIDYVLPIENLNRKADEIETAMCDTDAENEERLAEIELALCELDERG